ncbi:MULTISPECIES: amidohydrolase family protein [unclassified Pseudoalteromonas]|uniref:amidohydrolase family protein n=1 Tax=unclassified Pseudoalteromonas TaxID=194690 RepID=UPI002096E586|nr:amidohydrolase family protein [Pseudoalteromonas sp. XMcav2-N]MCO7189454.1 amidohydrolase family protein [Pseudoalteromonas sp. XMcav2-N]
MNKIIDPHLHFFSLRQGQYHWLKHNPPGWPNLDLIRQDHLPDALFSLSDFSLEGCVHIEAGFDNEQPQRELDWLAQLLPATRYKAVSYAQIDAPAAQFRRQLEALKHPSLVAIRDITEGQDAARLLPPQVADNLALLSENGLHFEAQFELTQHNVVTHLCNIARQLPNLRIMLNHSGLVGQADSWLENAALLAALPHCAIKFSGHELLASPLPLQDQLTSLLDLFGTERVMFASNHPVCLIRHDYQGVWQQYLALCRHDDALWHQLSYANAKNWYGFNGS